MIIILIIDENYEIPHSRKNIKKLFLNTILLVIIIIVILIILFILNGKNHIIKI